jgi:uroporphyrinogen decarboxylase
MDTPESNLVAVTEMVYDEYARQVVREMKQSSSLEPLDLKGHWMEGKVVIDVITLDSSSCAPCQYMMEAVKQAASDFGDRVIVTEHKIKEKDGIRMMMALGVQNVPTTCINGEVKFISQIPPRKEIVKAIESALA